MTGSRVTQATKRKLTKDDHFWLIYNNYYNLPRKIQIYKMVTNVE